ncbi:Lipocalin-like domain-containing protein, partial [Dysosmobacter welbionis]
HPGSGVDAPGGQIFLDHQSHLEGNGVVELPQVQARQLLDLLQPVHQSVPVDEQLPGGLGHVQVVLKELVDGEERLLVQCVDGVLFEHLLEEHLAQGGGQLINQPADAQILIVDDVLLRVKDLAHLNGDLCLLIALGQVP